MLNALKNFTSIKTILCTLVRQLDNKSQIIIWKCIFKRGYVLCQLRQWLDESHPNYWTSRHLGKLAPLAAGQNLKINPDYGKPTGIRPFDKLNCTTKFTDEVIQLIIDYALWRNVPMLYIVDESINSGCNMAAIRKSVNCLNENGISIALLRKLRSDTSFTTKANRVLVVLFINENIDFENYLDQINFLATSERSFKLLNIYNGISNKTAIEKRILETLKSSRLSLSVDVVLGIATSNSTDSHKRKYYERSCKRFLQSLSRGSFHKQADTLLPFRPVEPKNQTSNITFTRLCGSQYDTLVNSFCMLQLYKIRSSLNDSMVVKPLGFWNYETGTEKLKSYQSVESRINFHGFPLIFGKKEFNQDAAIVSDESLIEDNNDEENMDKIAEFLAFFLNAGLKTKTYPTLGLKTPSGNWTGLLGAVVSHEVDVGLDSVIKVSERYTDMAFTQDIMVSVRNIYVKPERSHSARDIFYAPFEPKLVLSVLGTGLIFAITMCLYILSSKLLVKERPLFSTYYLAISDALLWIIGVFSVQGSLIQPRSCSGNIIIVISLIFAYIIYSSYSAFITSMLSVKLTQIRSVDDLLRSDYDIGYAKNSQDEIFLRSMNHSQLNQIYLRGYLHNTINNITDGLFKATKGNYGFFATGHVARKQFWKISGYKCKYEIMEIPIHSTINTVAFPMSLTSPYRKAINLGLIKMTEIGVHDYITSLISPALPKCDQQTLYQSARLNDLITSFGLLGLGILVAVAAIMFECFWKKRKLVLDKIKGTHKTIINHSFEFVH